MASEGDVQGLLWACSKKLIGKKVDVTVDYISPANNGYPAKVVANGGGGGGGLSSPDPTLQYCCTVVVDKVNVSEALVSKGFATALRHR